MGITLVDMQEAMSKLSELGELARKWGDGNYFQIGEALLGFVGT